MSKRKDFDAVRMMREIRDELSRRLMTMDHEEQRLYVEEQLQQTVSLAQSQPQQTETAAHGKT